MLQVQMRSNSVSRSWANYHCLSYRMCEIQELSLCLQTITDVHHILDIDLETVLSIEKGISDILINCTGQLTKSSIVSFLENMQIV